MPTTPKASQEEQHIDVLHRALNGNGTRADAEMLARGLVALEYHAALVACREALEDLLDADGLVDEAHYEAMDAARVKARAALEAARGGK